MGSFKVTRRMEAVWDGIEADDAEAAIAATVGLEPLNVRVLSSKARDMTVRTPGEATITDRELRPGRVFTAKHKGQVHTLTVLEDGTLNMGGITYKSLNAAGMAICGHAVNAWAFFKEGEPIPHLATRSRKPKKAAKPKKARQTEALREIAQGNAPVEPPNNEGIWEPTEDPSVGQPPAEEA